MLQLVQNFLCYLLSVKRTSKFSNHSCSLEGSSTYLLFPLVTQHTVEMYLQKNCSLCPYSTQIFTSVPPLLKAEAAMLTVASLQSLFNGTSIPASPGKVTGGRWGGWLWLPAVEDQPAVAHIHFAKPYLLSVKSAETYPPLWTFWILRHGCHDNV